ncbi:MAG: hypothetical protein HYX92_15285 [Chloroflexi bacterium]|nr:hypothetical protein [Chloroflexota bacterium]
MKPGTCQYEVLHPWADVTPKPLKGLSPRLTDLSGKTIGMLFNHKPGARPILSIVEERLKQKYPTLRTSWYKAHGPEEWREYIGPDQDVAAPIFRDWVNGVDAVIAAHAD